MGVYKLKLQDFQNLQKPVQDLSEFWKGYFAGVAINLNHLFFKYTHQNVSVKYLHRDVIKGKDYLATMGQNSVIRTFKVEPHQGTGLFYLNNDLCNHLIDCLLGGGEKHATKEHVSTSVDQKILDHVLQDMLVVLQKQLTMDGRVLELKAAKTIDLNLFAMSAAAEQIISVQQFVVLSGNSSYVFDITFTNRVLEEFLLI